MTWFQVQLQNEFAREVIAAVDTKDRRRMIAAYLDLKRKAGTTVPGLQARQHCRGVLLGLLRYLRFWPGEWSRRRC
jgi:hypothetical protein